MSSRETATMKRHQAIGMVMFLTLAMGVGWGQNDPGQQPTGSAQPTSGQDNEPPWDTNPPISGIDQPSLGERFPTRSFLLPGAHVSEALDTNAGQTTGS